MKKKMVVLVAGFLCLVLFRSAFSQEMTVEQLTADMKQKYSSIQDFQVDMTTGMQMFGKMMNMEGTMWQKGKFLRVETTLPPEMIPRQNGSAEPLKMLQVFDGKTMWQWMPVMNMVTKIDFSGSEDKMKNTPFSIPQVSYALSEKTRNGKNYYFLWSDNAGSYMQNSGPTGVNASANTFFQSVGIWVDKTTLFPELVEFYSQDNTPAMYVEFKNVKTDQGLSPDLFIFKVPEGAQVMDMTETIKALSGKTTQQ